MENFEFDLDNVLDEVGSALVEQQAAEETEQQESSIPYLRFVQNMTKVQGWDITPKRHAMLTLAPPVNGKWQGILLQSPIFWVLDHLQSGIRINRNGIYDADGGRAMWGYDVATGKNLNDGNAPVCKSPDGKTPFEQHIGKVFTIPHTYPKAGYIHRIGYETQYDANGNPVDFTPITNPAEICEKCPLGQWSSTSSFINGKEVKKNSKPLCQESWRFVLWFPPQEARVLTGNDAQPYETIHWDGGMAVIQGSPTAIQLALRGVPLGKSGHAIDPDRPLPGLYPFFRPGIPVQVLVAKNEVREHMKPFAVTLQKTEKSKETIPAKFEGQYVDEWRDDSYKFVTLSVPQYEFAQNGLPEMVGAKAGLAGLRYLTWEIVRNGWEGNPSIPLFGVSDEAVDPTHYAAFLKAKKQYADEGIRDRLLATSNSTAVEQKLLAAPVAAPQLTSGDIVDNVDDLEDM